MNFKIFFIDLDETVYPASNGVWDAIAERMERYMHERLGFQREEIPALRRDLYQKYGTTWRGLQQTMQLDQRDFMDYVHNVPLERFLAPDQPLCEVLQRYPQRKIILTNADRKHAGRVMNLLQIDNCFESIIDVYDLAPHCKPLPDAFRIALKLAGDPPPEQCVFIDDSPKNLTGARALGMFTIRVGPPTTEAHAAIPTLADLPLVIPV